MGVLCLHSATILLSSDFGILWCEIWPLLSIHRLTPTFPKQWLLVWLHLSQLSSLHVHFRPGAASLGICFSPNMDPFFTMFGMFLPAFWHAWEAAAQILVHGCLWGHSVSLYCSDRSTQTCSELPHAGVCLCSACSSCREEGLTVTPVAVRL